MTPQLALTPAIKHPLSVADRTMNLRVNVQIVFRFLRVPVGGSFPIELCHKFFRTQMRLRISVTRNTPSHRQLFGLINDFHLVHPTVATHTAHAGIHVGGVIEIHKLRQIVYSLPCHTSTSLPTLANRSKFGAVCTNGRKSRDTLLILAAVAIDTGGRGRNRSVRGFEHSIVTIPAIHP